MPRDPLRSAAGLPLALGEHLAPKEQRYEPADPRMASGNLQNARERAGNQDALATLTDADLIRLSPLIQRLLKRRISKRGYMVDEDSLRRELAQTLNELRTQHA